MRHVFATLFATSLMQAYAMPWGTTHCHSETMHDFHAAGQVQITQCKLLGESRLEGQINATNSTFQRLSSMGQNDWTDCQFKQANVAGHLVAKQCQIEQALSVKSNAIELNDTQMGALRVESPTPSIIKLSHSTVHGDVTCIGAHGTIINDHSTIEGKVVNATVKNKGEV